MRAARKHDRMVYLGLERVVGVSAAQEVAEYVLGGGARLRGSAVLQRLNLDGFELPVREMRSFLIWHHLTHLRAPSSYGRSAS
jgi:hypothetical protein